MEQCNGACGSGRNSVIADNARDYDLFAFHGNHGHRLMVAPDRKLTGHRSIRVGSDDHVERRNERSHISQQCRDADHGTIARCRRIFRQRETVAWLVFLNFFLGTHSTVTFVARAYLTKHLAEDLVRGAA